MNQVKKVITQIKKAKKVTPKTKMRNFKKSGKDWKLGHSEEDLAKMASVLHQAVILARQGESLSLVLPYCDIREIDLDILQFSGTTNATLAKKLGTNPLDTHSSLPELINTYGNVYIMTGEGKILGSNLEIKEIKVEKEVIKEVKTTQKDILKAIDNTKFKMKKIYQEEAVKAILNDFLNNLKK